jgi:hypothetical protein
MKTRYVRSILLVALLLLEVACLRSEASSQAPEQCKLAPPTEISRADLTEYRKLVREIYAYSLGTDKLGRPASLQPDTVLPRLHPWFQEGKSFCKESSEEMTILRLAPIPDQVIAEISAFSGSDVWGIGVLNGDFWRDVARIQNAGVEAAFLMNPGEYEFAGYYSPEFRHIVFDILANPGTPTHEFRHHEQYMAVQGATPPVQQAAPLSSQYSPDCQVAARRFFDELDATSFQIRHWIPTLKFDDSVFSEDKGSLPLFPHLELLQGFLNYPALAAGWVEAESCPAQLADLVGNIKRRTQRYQSQMVGPIGDYKQLSTGYIADLPTATNTTEKQDLDNLRSRIQASLNSEATARPQDLRSMLMTIPQQDRSFLSSISGGFKFLNEFKGY